MSISPARTLAIACVTVPSLAGATQLEFIGRYETGIFDSSGAEIVAHDPVPQRLFLVNGATATFSILDFSDPAQPVLIGDVDLAALGGFGNSVDVHDGIVAVAIENADRQAPGWVAFFDTDGNWLHQVSVGAVPDMLTFTPDGSRVLVANEAEPSDDYTVDPEGSVSSIDLSDGIANATVTTIALAIPYPEVLDDAIRIYGLNATEAQDLEPEYIAVSSDSRLAWVTLQENNAIAKIDLGLGVVVDVAPLGTIDHSVAGFGIDPSDRDNAIAIGNWPVRGMFEPDAIAAYEVGGSTYLVTANEGDTRAYSAFDEEARVSSLDLDPTMFPDAAGLKANAKLGRLTVTTASGDLDGDGDYDELWVPGTRSFSIWNADGDLVFDSGEQIEQITAAAYPDQFNSNNDANDSFDSRSDNKGPEPEGVAVGTIGDATFAFVGLERIGGIVVFDISVPSAPVFVDYVNSRDFGGDPESGTAGDLGPEGVRFIPADQSPTGENLVVVGYEVSGTVGVFAVRDLGNVTDTPESTTAPTLHLSGPSPLSRGDAIVYRLPEPATAQLTLHDVSGRTLMVLADGWTTAGEHRVTLADAPSGVHFLRLSAQGLVTVRKIVITQ